MQGLIVLDDVPELCSVHAQQVTQIMVDNLNGLLSCNVSNATVVAREERKKPSPLWWQGCTLLLCEVVKIHEVCAEYAGFNCCLGTHNNGAFVPRVTDRVRCYFNLKMRVPVSDGMIHQAPLVNVADYFLRLRTPTYSHATAVQLQERLQPR